MPPMFTGIAPVSKFAPRLSQPWQQDEYDFCPAYSDIIKSGTPPGASPTELATEMPLPSNRLAVRARTSKSSNNDNPTLSMANTT